MADEPKTFDQGAVDKIVTDRIAEITTQRDEARKDLLAANSKIDDMTNKVTSYQALSTETEKAKEDAKLAKAAHETDKATWARDREIMRMGVQDEDVAELVKIKYGKQVEGGEADFGKWLGTQKTEAYLKPFIGAAPVTPAAVDPKDKDAVAAAAAAAAAAGVKPGVVDPANAGDPKTPAPGNEADPVAISRMDNAEFMKNAGELTKGLWPT